MTSKLTIEQAKRLRNDFECWQQDYDPKDDKEQYDMFGRGMTAMDMLIAGMHQEPVAYIAECGTIVSDADPFFDDYKNPMPVYRHAQPAPELAAIVERLNLSGYEYEGGEVTPQNAAAIVDTLLQQLDDAVQGRNAQPAPVVPAVSDDIGEIRVGRLPTMNQDDYPGLGDWWVQLRIGEDSDEVLARVYGATPQEANSRAEALACRAAMLQAGNSPVIPDGYVMVPKVPTEDMVIAGFESEPDEDFSDPAVWEEYQAMSGCRQAAHRAKLCWAAMIAAAPKLGDE